MTQVASFEYRKVKKSLNDVLSCKLVQRLSNGQKQELYRDVLGRLFNNSIENVEDNNLSNVDKLFHFDLMKASLIKIGKLISTKFKELDNLENDAEEVKLIQVLNDTIDHPITLPYLIPNLCECIQSSIEFLFRQSNNQKIIQIKIDEKISNPRQSTKVCSENELKKESKNELNDNSIKNDTKKIYKIYSSNKTSEYFESKRTTTKKFDCGQENLKNEKEKKNLEQKIDAIASESNKLHKLNQHYRKNKEEMEDELAIMKEKYHELIHELETKTLLIEEKQSQFNEMEIELNAIKVQLQIIYKQNQLLDTDKLNLSSNASDLTRRIEELERQNNISKDECLKLKQLIENRDLKIQHLESEFNEKRSNLESNQIQLRKLINEEQNYKRLFNELETQEKEIKLKYEKIIKELELKQENLIRESSGLKEEFDNLKIKFDEKLQENFKLNLELKEQNLKIENLKKDKQDHEELWKRYREDKSMLLKKLDQNNQELNKIKKLNLESNQLIENKQVEIEQLQLDLNSIRNENVELTNKLMIQRNENTKQLESEKKLFSNEIKQKNQLLDRLNESFDDLKSNYTKLNEEKKIYLKLFNCIESVSKSNYQLPTNLNQEFKDQNDIEMNENCLKFEHYLDSLKELKNEFESKQSEINRLKELNRLIENQYDEQKKFLQTIQQKLSTNNSQLKIKDCELIHLRDELAEHKVKQNENESEKLNLMKENENLKSDKSNLELMKLELKKQITNHQLRNIELENELEINLNKIIDLNKYINELNEKCKQLDCEFKNLKEQLIESSNVKDQLERELMVNDQKLKEIEQSYANEKELNLNLNQINQQSNVERNKLEKDLNNLKYENQQLENEMDKIEKDFKDYETRYKGLIDGQNLLTDLLIKYNIILKSHLSVSLQNDENCFEFTSINRTNLKIIKPDRLIEVLLEVQNDQSKLKRQIELMKVKLNEHKFKLKEELGLNQQYKSMIELNESNLISKKVNYERLYNEQKDFKIQLEQTLDENERLKIEKQYLTEKVLSLDKILESTKEFMEKKFDETVNESKSLIKDKKLKRTINSLEHSLDRDESNLDDLEMRLICMHESLTEFINILIDQINDYKKKLNQLNEMNKVLNDRLNEMNQLIDKTKDNENRLQLDNENLKKELINSNHNLKEFDNKAKQLNDQIIDLQNECLTLQNSLESNRLTMNDLIETNDRLKLRIKQLEATINLCEIKIRENERNINKKSNQVITRDNEIVHLRTDQNHMQDELKKLQLQNKLMNNELNQTLIKSPVKRPIMLDNLEENLNKFILINQPNQCSSSLNTFRQQKQMNKKIVKKINVINK